MKYQIRNTKHSKSVSGHIQEYMKDVSVKKKKKIVVHPEFVDKIKVLLTLPKCQKVVEGNLICSRLQPCPSSQSQQYEGSAPTNVFASVFA